MANASWYGYHYRVAGVLKHAGITTDPNQRQRDHQRRWPGGVLTIMTNALSEAQARAWEATQPKTVTP
jgi:hypothetical protein